MDNPTSVLIGKPLWRSTRAADMACFQFGGRHKRKASRGVDAEVGDYSLHVQCSWRITRGDEIVVGKEDLYQPEGPVEIDNYFDWQKNNLLDARLKTLFADNQRQFAVVGTALRAAGQLDILFDDELRLEVFPNSSVRTSEVEHWRLFTPGLTPEEIGRSTHLVFAGDGLHFESQ